MKLKPVHIVPFRLNNIGDFIDRDHPVLFPESPKYGEYWTERARRCVEGHWGYDFDIGKGGWRYMPGNLYFYTNFFPILHEGDQGTEFSGFPLLRDIDWMQFYAYMECDGFAGFADDDVYTCFRPIGKLERGEQISNKEKKLIDRYGQYLYNKKGKLKKYIDAKEYLYQTFPEPLGLPLILNEARNIVFLSSRAVGKSYGVAGGVVTYDFTFNGARTFYDYSEKKTSTTVVVGAGVSTKSKEFLDKVASGYDFLRTSVGAFSDGQYTESGCFWRPYEGSLSLNHAITNRVKTKGGKGYDGPGSKIVHVSYQQSASAGVGYRARRMVVEEAGLLEKFTQVHAENSATQRRETKMGYTIYLGTGGDIDKIRQIRDAFYNPESYDCVSFPDIFNGTGKPIGMFIPAYYRSALFKDENGNTDVKAAFDDEMMERDKKRKEGSKAYEGHIISYPILPQEMFMQSGGNAFPTDLIEARINELEISGEYKKYSVGHIHYVSMKNDLCEWKEDTKKELRPILRFGDEDNMHDKRGAIVIYEHPPDDKPKPTYTNPLFLVVYDPVAKDGIGTSLCSVLVFKTWYLDDLTTIQFNVVAEWIGRHERQDDNHEMAFRLAAYYGAKILPEINNTDILRYARMTNRYHWLQPRPGLALSGMVDQKSNYDVGIKISPTMIPHLEAAGVELLTTSIDKSIFIDGADEMVVDTKMVSKMRSMRLLEELLYYNRDDNFDHVSAMFLIAVWIRQQKLQPVQYAAMQNIEKDSLELKALFSPRPTNTPHPAFNY